jgi:hypothetical protein
LLPERGVAGLEAPHSSLQGMFLSQQLPHAPPQVGLAANLPSIGVVSCIAVPWVVGLDGLPGIRRRSRVEGRGECSRRGGRLVDDAQHLEHAVYCPSLVEAVQSARSRYNGIAQEPLGRPSQPADICDVSKRHSQGNEVVG